MKRFREPCRICKGLSKSPCVICKQFVGKVSEMSDLEQLKYAGHKEMIEYLQMLYDKMKACPSTHPSGGTGDPSTDENIKKWIGEWRW